MILAIITKECCRLCRGRVYVSHRHVMGHAVIVVVEYMVSCTVYINLTLRLVMQRVQNNGIRIITCIIPWSNSALM